MLDRNSEEKVGAQPLADLHTSLEDKNAQVIELNKKRLALAGPREQLFANFRPIAHQLMSVKQASPEAISNFKDNVEELGRLWTLHLPHRQISG